MSNLLRRDSDEGQWIICRKRRHSPNHCTYDRREDDGKGDARELQIGLPTNMFVRIEEVVMKRTA